MAKNWICERNDMEGVFVYYDERPGEIAAAGHSSEAEAWRYGLECLLIRRHHLSVAIKDARRELRLVERRATPDALKGGAK